MADRARSATNSVVITGSCDAASREDLFARMPTARRRGFNELLPDPIAMRGIYIGGTGNYDLFIQESGENDGDVTPYFQIVGGVVHPISACRIIKNDRYSTDAPNIVILY